MNITHYMFASYVFLLLFVLIWFCGRVMRSDKKKDKSSYDKEQRLYKLYQNIEDMLGGFEEYAEEAKTAMDERLKQAEALIEELMSATENRPAAECKPKTARETGPAPETWESKEQNSAGNAPERPKRRVEELIPQYIAKGMDKEEIAKALGISSREVSLIMQIKKLDIADVNS